MKEVEPKELHLLMTAYTNALFEVVVHDFTKEEALHYWIPCIGSSFLVGGPFWGFEQPLFLPFEVSSN